MNEHLKSFLETFSKIPTREEFITAFKTAMEQIAKAETKMSDKMDKKHSQNTEEIRGLMADVEQAMEEMRSATSSTFAQIRQRSMESISAMFSRLNVQGKMDAMYAEHEEMMKKMDEAIPDHDKMMKEMMDKMPPETGETIVDKINDADGKIDKERIEGLEDEIKALRKEIATKTSGGVRRVYQPYVDDFTSQTNGSLKIFALSREPLKTGSAMVYGTDFPTILRPNIDFTIVGKTLTLTSAVPAPNTGATLICTFFA